MLCFCYVFMLVFNVMKKTSTTLPIVVRSVEKNLPKKTFYYAAKQCPFIFYFATDSEVLPYLCFMLCFCYEQLALLTKIV